MRYYGRTKRKEAAHLILHHRLSSSGVVARALRVTPSRARTNIRQWVHRGAMRYVPLPLTNRKLLVLTPAGAADARSALQLDVSYSAQPARIGRSLIAHTLGVQTAAIDIDQRLNGNGLHSRRVYRPEAVIGDHLFQIRVDVLIDAIGVEVELTRKTPSQLQEKFRAAAALILNERNGLYIMVWYVPQGPDGLQRAHEWLTNQQRLCAACERIKIVSCPWLDDGSWI